jgi:ABC-type molybdate transport system ATPase subunit
VAVTEKVAVPPEHTACACMSVRAASLSRGQMVRASVAADQVILTLTNPASSSVSLIVSLVKCSSS